MAEPKKKSKLSPSQELKILRKIVDITSSKLELDVVLKDVVAIVTDMTNADSVFVYLFDTTRKNLILQASKTPHKREVGTVHLRAGEGITGWVAKEKTPVCIKAKAYEDKRFKSFDILPEDKYETFLSVPIVYKNKIIGVINIQHKQPHTYSPSMVNLVADIAKQVGGVIENARLYDDTKSKAAQFDALAKISESIVSDKYLDEILNLIVVVTAGMLNSKICSVMLLDDKKQNLVIKATQYLGKKYNEKPPVKVRSSLSGSVVLSKEARAVYDVTKEAEYQFVDVAKKEGLNSLLIVPMIVHDEAIGVVNVYTKDHHDFTQEEIDTLQIVANQAAVGIEKTQLMQETLEMKETLETRKVVERAKGILMESNKVSEKEAYNIIRKKSMDSCRSMKEIAEAIILAADLAIK